MSVREFNTVLPQVPQHAGQFSNEDLAIFMPFMVRELCRLSDKNPQYPFISTQILTAWESYKDYVFGNRQLFQLNGIGLPDEIAILAFFMEMVKFPRYGNVPVDSIRTMGLYNYYQDNTLRTLVESAAISFEDHIKNISKVTA